jgi:pimeloyl-ACP methyl ester carboxylesterase
MRVLRAITLFAIAFLGWTAQGAAEERPVVFVPGILGSRLCDAHENVVWGTRNSFSNLAQLELDVPSNPVLHPCGLVEEIQILGSLWTHNTYKSWMTGLADIGFSPEKKNLFIFAYDWRFSNFENAKRLDAFIAQNIGSGRKFDIVAHSMGGIVSRIYLDEYASARSVQQIIYLGTPFLGSMNAFGTIKEGWGWPFDAMAGGQEVVARVSVSFAGMLELLPRYEECCYIRKVDNSRKYLDIFDPQVWQSLGWLPVAYSNPQKFARFAEALKRSKGLTPLLSQPAPTGVYEMIFASDIHDTLRLLGMKEGATTPPDWVFTSSKGDGTVPVWSVARRMKSDGYSNTLPSFAKHEHLFDDKWVDNTIFRNLVSARPNEPFKISAPSRPALSVMVNGAPQVWPIRIATLVLDKKVFKPGELATSEFTIELEDTASDLAPGIYRPKASIEQSGQSQPLEVHELTNSEDLRAKQLRFSASAQVRSDEGIGVMLFHVDDTLESSQAFYVSPAIH